MSTEYEWERRRSGELTPIYLGRVLDWVGGLGDMPRRAREAHFDDYFAPPEVATGMELHMLVAELELRSRRLSYIQRQKINAVIKAVKTGEFDATREEAQRWGQSKEGQETFRMLLEGD